MAEHRTVRKPAKSFIVRIWSNDDNKSSELRGEVEYVRTGEKRLFGSESSLLALLEAWREDFNVVR